MAGKEESERKLALFRVTYPEASNKPDAVKALWLALEPADWDLLIAAAKGARAERERNPKKALFDQSRFLRDRSLWAEYAAKAPVVPPPPVHVAPGSTEDRAWLVFFRIVGWRWQVPPERLVEGQGMRRFWPSEVPKCGLGYGRFADLPAERWTIFRPDEANYVAWANKLRDWTGAWPGDEIILLDELDTIARPDGTTFSARKRLRGRRFPHPWPLSKAAAADPAVPIGAAAASLMTADDYEELAKGGTR